MNCSSWGTGKVCTKPYRRMEFLNFVKTVWYAWWVSWANDLYNSLDAFWSICPKCGSGLGHWSASGASRRHLAHCEQDNTSAVQLAFICMNWTLILICFSIKVKQAFWWYSWSDLIWMLMCWEHGQLQCCQYEEGFYFVL